MIKHIMYASLLVAGLWGGMAAGQQGWTLLSNYGAGLSVFRDLGTSPLSYHGLDGVVGLGLERTKRHSFSLYAEGMYGGLHRNGSKAFKYPQSGGYLLVESDFGHPLKNGHKVGIGLSIYNDFRHNASLGNTSLMFTGLTGCRLSYEIPRIWGWSRHNERFGLTVNRQFWARIDLIPYGWLLRPGYGYNNNFTADNDTGNLLLENYSLSGKFLPAISTQIGYSWGRNDRSPYRLCYRWTYLSTGNSGAYLCQIASHSLLFQIPLASRIKTDIAL